MRLAFAFLVAPSLGVLAACAPDTAYLDRWDDPRVIQFEAFHLNCQCVRISERPIWHEDAKPAPFEGGFECPGC